MLCCPAKNSLLNPRSQIFSSKSFLILHFTFMSIIHFVKFCARCEVLVKIHVFVVYWCPFVLAPLLKNLTFFYLVAFVSLSKISWPGASLVAQWLRICLLMQGTRVRALVWEDPTCHGATGPVSHSY